MKKFLSVLFIILLVLSVLIGCTQVGEEGPRGDMGSNGTQGIQGEKGDTGDDGIIFFDTPVVLFDGTTLSGKQTIDLSAIFIGTADLRIKFTNNEVSKTILISAEPVVIPYIVSAGKSLKVPYITEDNTFIYEATSGKLLKIELLGIGQ